MLLEDLWVVGFSIHQGLTDNFVSQQATKKAVGLGESTKALVVEKGHDLYEHFCGEIGKLHDEFYLKVRMRSALLKTRKRRVFFASWTLRFTY